MAITSAIANSFKQEILVGTHNFTASSGNTYKIALIKANASQSGTYNAGTVNYSVVTGNSDELANGSGYTTGGNTLVSVTPVLDSSTAVCDFANTSWSSATFTTRGCIIYNSSASNKAVMVLDFGADYSVSNGTFTVEFPTANSSNAIIRIS